MFAAVQQERKPPELKDGRSNSSMVNQSGHHVFLQKDLENSSSSLPTFTEKSEVRSEIFSIFSLLG